MRTAIRLPNDPELIKLKVNCANDAQMVKESLRVPHLLPVNREKKSDYERAMIKKFKNSKSNSTLRDDFISTILGYKNKIKFNIVLKVV